MDIQELREWDELFSTAGWRRLVEQAKTEVEGLAELSLNQAKGFEDVTFLRGQAVQLYNVIGLEDAILNMAKAERDEEDADL